MIPSLGGSVRSLKRPSAKWRRTFTRDVMNGHVFGTCQQCDCIVDSDRVTSLMRCGACHMRPLLTEDQQWTDDEYEYDVNDDDYE